MVQTGTPVAVQHTPPVEKPHSAPKPSTPATTSFPDRPYICPYEGCDKAYIHSYKLNLHLKTQHPEHGQEENGKLGASGQHGVNETSYQYNYAEVGDTAPNPKRSKTHKVHSSKVYNTKISTAMPSNISVSSTSGQVRQRTKMIVKRPKKMGATTMKMAGQGMATMLMMRKLRMKIDQQLVLVPFLTSC